MPGHLLIVDAKTGRQRESDFWQVLTYLYAQKLESPQVFAGDVVGEVHYKAGNVVPVKPTELEGARLQSSCRW
jgi:hypothetical protein